MEFKQRIAIYPGYFNPFTIFNLNILEKAEDIFGKENVIISVAERPTKSKSTMPSSFDRAETIQFNLQSKKIERFSKFLTDYVSEKEKAGFDVTVVFGVRNGKEVDEKVNNIRFMQDLKPDIKTMFIVCDREFEHISSKSYREMEALSPFIALQYLAKEI